MSTDKSIRKNYIYNLTYQILLIITPLITAPYLARVLEADGVGTYSFIDSILQCFTLFTAMGIGIYGQREISYFQDNRKERSRIFWELKLLTAINASVLFVVYLVCVGIYSEANRVLCLIMSFRIINVAFDVTWFFAGMEDFGKIVLRNIIVKILDIAFIFLFVKQKTDLTLHVAGSLFFIVAGSVSLWSYLPEYIDGPDIKALKPYRNIRVIWSLFIPTIAMQIYTVLDKTMLGVLTQNAAENGYYEQTMRITRMTMALVTSLGSVIVPRIGYLFGKNEHAAIQLYMYRSFRFVLFVAIPSCLGMTAIAGNFVPWFFGAGYDKVTGLIQISSLLFIAIGLSNAAGIQYLIPTKRQNIFTWSVTSGAVLNFVLNIIFIRLFMSYGAMAASVIAEFFVTAFQLYFLRKELSFIEIICSGKNYYISGLCMLAVLELIGRHLEPSVINTFIMIFTGGLTYAVILVILRDDFFIGNTKRVYTGITKKFRRK